MLWPGAIGTPLSVTAAVAVIEAEPLLPSLVAVMVADPPATAVTSPLADTFATPTLEELHVTVLPVSVLPAASFSVATACVVPATGSVAEPTVTLTEATAVCDAVLLPLVVHFWLDPPLQSQRTIGDPSADCHPYTSAHLPRPRISLCDVSAQL